MFAARRATDFGPSFRGPAADGRSGAARAGCDSIAKPVLRLPDSVAPPLPPDFACKRNLEVGVDRGFAENRGAARSRRSLRPQGCKRTPYPALAHRDCAEHNVL